jgi:LemA protein
MFNYIFIKFLISLILKYLTTMIVTYALIGFVVLLAFYGIGVYNKLVKLTTLVDEAWSGIDVQLKKRYDLIPNLVETVKGYASHEKETFENVTKARNQAQNATTVEGQQAAENQLNRALINLYAVAEQYPELKANENFLSLQNELSVIESDIEKSRRYYNGTTRDYNILIDQFPSNIIAGMANFKKAGFFEIDIEAERKNPQVKF